MQASLFGVAVDGIGFDNLVDSTEYCVSLGGEAIEYCIALAASRAACTFGVDCGSTSLLMNPRQTFSYQSQGEGLLAWLNVVMEKTL